MINRKFGGAERMLWCVCVALLCELTVTIADAAPATGVAVTVERMNGPSPAFEEVSAGTYEVRGPQSLKLTPQHIDRDEKDLVLEWEYFCEGGVKTFACLAGPPFEPKSAQFLPAMGHSEVFSSYRALISRADKNLPDQWSSLRLDLKLEEGQILQLRNVRIRPMQPGEFEKKPTAALASVGNVDDLNRYLNTTYSANVTRVNVGTETIQVEGHVSGANDQLFLCDVPMETIEGQPTNVLSQTPIKLDVQKKFVLTLPRKIQRGGKDYDRFSVRWQIFRRVEDNLEALSAGHYADSIACRSPDLPIVELRSKKGLGGWNPRRQMEEDELNELGIASVTVNLFGLHQFVSLTPQDDASSFVWQGETYYVDESAFRRFDQVFLEAARHDVMVMAILLVNQVGRSRDKEGKLLAHPNADPEGKFAMPNVTSREGIEYYGAILNCLAERYSRADGKYGRVHHWIMHNEIDAGWVWTNAGEIEDVVYMDLYVRSMRLLQLIANQYDPHARAMITLTHHWADAGQKKFYGSKRMLELLSAYCRTEGDFAWGLAYHPYPQSLFNPRTWEDRQATFSFQTKKITPWNLEVLDAFMKQPSMRYQGQLRPVHLSENGFNSKDYSPKSLEDQAAGMAVAWKKMENLSSIKGWQYHNWIDNRNEGGLRIGLRKFDDDEEDPLGKKPIWHLYQALGTPAQKSAMEPYLKTVGISSWDEVLYKLPIR